MMSGIHIRWYDEQRTILIANYEKLWSWEDYFEVSKDGVGQVTRLKHNVVIIHDQPTLPADRSALFTQLKWSREHIPDNVVGTVVILSRNSFTTSLTSNILSIWQRLRAKKDDKNLIFIVYSMHEALETAQELLEKYQMDKHQ
jgi:rhodanese-related sulfurtransferase